MMGLKYIVTIFIFCSISIHEADALTFIPSFASYRVEENATIGTTVTTLQASGSNSVRYQIVDSSALPTFSIGLTSGEIKVNAPLDYETAPAYYFQVSAVDRTGLTERATIFINMQIIDYNDESPVFLSNLYTVDITSKIEGEATILHPKAEDKDASDVVEYFLPEGVDVPFFIDRSTGSITVGIGFASSAQIFYQFDILAIDKLGNEGSAGVEIYVYRDSPASAIPIFDKLKYTGNVPENETTGFSILAVRATAGSAPIGLTYSIPDQGNVNVFLVRIDSQSGIISLAEIIDYERIKQLLFIVEARTREGFSSTAVVEINVVNVDDNPFTIFYPQNNPYVVEINELTNIGQMVGYIVITDADFDNPVDIPASFSFTPESGTFSISKDNNKAAITLKSKLDHATSSSYNLNCEITVQEVTRFLAVNVVIQPAGRSSLLLFNPTVDKITLNEASPIETVIYNANVTDQAVLVTYSMVDSSDGYFSVDLQTGKILLIKPLSYMTAKNHVVVIKATQQSGVSPISSDFVLVIEVEKGDNFAPEFQTTAYTMQILEGLQANTPVGLVTATDRDGVIKTYTIESAASGFNISDKGLISTLAPFDYETGGPTYMITISATDDNNRKSINQASVTVNIIDVNDNNPKFEPTSEYLGFAYEDNAADTSILKVSATDQDLGQNDTIKYSFIDPTTIRDFLLDSASGEISLARRLPIKTPPYVFYVVAIDQGEPVRQAVATVTVSIRDVNEAPSFSLERYNLQVSESLKVGSSIPAFSVIDGDVGSNRGYTVTADPATPFKPTVTGNFELLTALDYETENEYRIEIKVVDTIDTSLFNTATVTVALTNSLDSQPKFGQSPYIGRVKEGNLIGEFVLAVEAVDPDLFSPIFYVLLPSDDAMQFSMAVNGSITTTQTYDYERQHRYVMEVMACVRGCLFNSKVLVIVEIEDINDHSPVFLANDITITIPSTAPVEYVVTELFANDLDSGENGKITFKSEDVLSPFQIVNRSLVIASPLTTISNSEYSFSIYAVDSGVPIRRSETDFKLIVKVIALDARGTQVVVPVYNISIQEKTLPGQEFWRAPLATALGGTIDFSFVSNSQSDNFEIDSTTGGLQLKQGSLLRYQLQNSYILNIFQKGSLSGTQRSVLCIRIIDGNTYLPVFENILHDIQLRRSTRQGTVFLKLTAKDNDLLSSNDIEYFLTTSNGEGLFQVSNDGIISTNASLRSTPRNDYQLTVIAKDPEFPNDVSVDPAIIRIAIVEDTVPMVLFEKAEYRGTVAEGEFKSNIITPNIVVFGQLLDNRQYLYSFVDNQEAARAFSINSITGAISSKILLDRESRNQYSFYILVIYEGTIQDTTRIVIDVTDVNDNSPVISNRLQNTFGISESEFPPVLIMNLLVTDIDDGINAQLNYVFQRGNDDNTFAIDQSTGSLRLAKRLNYEVKDRYELKIFAEDNGEVRRQSNVLTVTVNVLDDNEFNPVFDNTIYSANIDETDQPNIELVQVNASDIDSFGEIFYTIADPELRELFAIDDKTGKVTNKEALDYESTNQYSFLVEAYDNAESFSQLRRYGACLVTISIMDKNDNKPEILQSFISEGIQETVAVDTIVAEFSTRDLDEGINGEVEYQIIFGDQNQDFRIDEKGLMRVAKPLSYSNKPTYNITIIVRDKGSPTLLANGFITVLIDVSRESTTKVTVEQNYFNVSVRERREGVILFVINVTSSSVAHSYTIVDTFWPEHIVIDQSTGLVALIKALDYEDKSKHSSLCIYVSSTNTPDGYGAVITADVHVTDMNEQGIFLSSNYGATIDRNAPIGTFVAQVKARDPDNGSNGELSYQIVGDNSLISIDNYGLVTLQSSPINAGQSQMFQISAKDKGNPSISVAQDTFLTINFTDTVEELPIFSRTIYLESINTDVPTGSSFLQINVSNTDSIGNVFYQVPRDSDLGKFSLDSSTGDLSITQSLTSSDAGDVSFCVTAYRQDNPLLKSTIGVEIRVIDDRNTRPIVLQEVYDVYIIENNRENIIIADLLVEDDDIGENGQLNYQVYNNTPARTNPDIIINDNGQVLLVSKFDYEEVRFIRYLIRVADKGTPPLTAEKMMVVNIFIEDDNEDSPMFIDTPYDRVIDETDVLRDILTVNAHTSADFEPIVYMLLPTRMYQPFALDYTTGVLTNTALLDYENRTEYQFCVTAAAENGTGRISVINFTIRIQNINDNKPMLIDNDQPLVYRISESIPIPSTIANIHATDADEDNRNLQFRIVNGNLDNLFEFNKTGGTLYIMNKPDYEANSYYNLTCVITDSMSPSMDSIPFNIEIFITDSNDNIPMFNQSIYRVSVQEDIQAGTSILQVFADDMDATDILTYDIPFDWLEFSITDDGTLINLVPLDYETTKTIRICIRASDSLDVDFRHVALATVELTIKNVNEFAPMPMDDAIVTMREDALPGKIVTILSATDQDDGRAGEINFRINPNTDVDSTFRIDDNLLKLSKPLDFEVKESFNLSIHVSDNGIPKLDSSRNLYVIVNVFNLNDNPPVFDDSPSRITLRTPIIVSQLITTLSATDPDVGNQVSYTLEVSPSSNRFALNSISGELRSTVSENITQYIEYMICIKATEIGSSDQFTTKSIIIAILPINHRPIINQDRYVVTLPEDVIPGTFVTQLDATDIDQRDDGKLQYRMMNDINNEFSIDGTGVVTVNERLDFEAGVQRDLIILVRDMADPPLQAEGEILLFVTIQDINDDLPIFEESIYEKEISETDLLGISILSVRANMQNSLLQVKYRLNAGRAEKYFSLNETDGVLRNVLPIDYEETKEFSLCVEALNSLNPSVKGLAQIKIKVTNVNDNPPIPRLQSYATSISELTPVPSHVIHLTSTDEDQYDTKPRFFAISGNGTSKFTVESEGHVMLTSSVTTEVGSTYVLEASVSDEGVPPLEAVNNIIITIHIINNNDNDPVFNESAYDVRIDETDSLIGSLTTIYATDSDNCGGIHYSILSSEARQTFNINKDTGIISTITALDYEQIQYIRFLVTATDSCIPKRKSSIDVSVIIQNINDNPPRFMQNNITLNVYEQANIDDILFVFNAEDKDVNDMVSYSIHMGEVSTFKIEQNHLILIKRFNYDQTRKYRLVIQATDNGVPALTDTFNIEINVIRITTEIPEFKKDAYIWPTSDIVNGETIGQIEITNNEALNGVVAYYLPNSTYLSDIKINPTNGMISATVDLPKDNRYLYSFCARAEGPGGQAQASWVPVDIQVNSTSNKEPEFIKDKFIFNVSEAALSGTIIGVVKAIDKDKGVKGEISYVFRSMDDIFGINKFGEISLLKVLDTESSSIYRLEVEAFNKEVTPAGSESVANVVILVQGINDNGPIFVSGGEKDILADESKTKCQDIADLSAEDKDNDAIEYRILPSGDDGMFVIDSDTGQLSCMYPLDAEKQTTYHFTVEACDVSNYQWCSFILIDLTVNDVDDTPPECIMKPYEYQVDVNSPSGTIIGIMSAKDVDTPKDDIKFNIISNNSSFDIGLSSGALSLTEKHDATGITTIQINVTDGGGQSIVCDVNIEFTGEVNTEKPMNNTIPPTSGSSGELVFQLDISGFENWENITEYSILLQEYHPEENDFELYTNLPYVTWYQVNKQASENKNYLRRYLAEIFRPPVPSAPLSRKRRANDDFLSTGFITFTAGINMTCINDNTPGIPCNGPLQPGQAYRVQVLVDGNPPTYTATTAPATANGTTPSTLIRPDTLHFEVYYIIGLSTLGVLCVIMFAVIIAILMQKKRPFLSRNNIIFTSDNDAGLPRSIDEKRLDREESYYRARVLNNMYTIRPEARQQPERIDSFKFTDARTEYPANTLEDRDAVFVSSAQDSIRPPYKVKVQRKESPVYTLPYRSPGEERSNRSKNSGESSGPTYDAVLLRLEDIEEMQNWR